MESVLQQSTVRLVKYWDRTDAPEVALTVTAALLLIGVIFLKAGLWQWCKGVYERNPQDAVKAIAQDNLNDVISNIAALLAPEESHDVLFHLRINVALAITFWECENNR
ncbi:unnamed protein product [Cladocopium goreaui]|uniref:Metal tolerance protein 4 n=1 Tax=Cladocopium goreaui TaxID=2562237 RepID=A0A9P1G558_9DINO|nr:unnamed protein product [Cladocopium goreaui]